MNWININTSQSRDPRYMDSPWLERGAWLSMVCYCTERETDGVIVGARLWSDRQWLISPARQRRGVALQHARNQQHTK
jgi:hypothetical protein